jgi:CBS domain-containing protein
MMQVSEIMSRNFNNIGADAAIRHAAKRMRDLDVGILPVEQNGDIVGTVTDRDIAVRAIASGADPNTTPVSNVMSTQVYVCLQEDDLQQAARIMEKYQIRRLMVQDGNGNFVGMLSLADLARHREAERLGAQILEEISQPSGHAVRH